VEKNKRPLTDRQRDVLELIRRKMEEDHCPPTVREIGDHFDIRSTNGVRVILDALEKKGYLKRSPRLSRGLSVIDQSGALEARENGEHEEQVPQLNHRDFVQVPLIGRVAAGNPIAAIEHPEDTLTIPRNLLSITNAFALRVQGDSMVDAGILHGDIVFAQPIKVAQRGQTVVARVGDEATVKDFFPDGNRVRLQPRNSAYDPIWVSSTSPDFEVMGKVIGVFRNM
jgi:repressor LexA